MKTNYSATALQPVIRDYGCRSRMPHDLKPVFENKVVKIEVCQICGKRLRFRKYFKGRVDNRAYLEAHSRNFAQSRGRTKRLYMKIYKPQSCLIKI